MENKKGGIGVLWALTLIFITLKLCKVITWSWWWVLSPVLIPMSLAIGLFCFSGICLGVKKIIDGRNK